MTRTLTALLCATALATPLTALAQSTSGPVPDTAPPRPPRARHEAAGGGVQEVIVTAQRRSEKLQKVPLAVAVVSAKQLTEAGITDLQSLRVVVPGLTFSSIQQNVQPRLRGIGSSTAGPGIESEVAVYVDGVYYASATGALFSFNNVQQISVLKGPQGTLFGRNAVAGLVQVTTRDPTQTPVTEASFGFGNYETATESFYVAGGLADDLAADLAFQGKEMGQGYGRNLTTGKYTKQTDHDLNFRSKFLYTPTADTKITLSMDYADIKGTQGTDRLEPGSIPAAGTGPNFKGSPWDVTADVPGFNDNKNGGVSLKIAQQLGYVNLLSITAYRRLDYENQLDLDFTATPNQGIRQSQHDEQFSQEFQIQSAVPGPFKWTAGVFYFNADDVSDPLIVNLYGDAISPFFPLDQAVTIGGQKTNSLAEYGQASYTFATKTTITLGGRYTDERRTADTSETLNLEDGIPSIVVPPAHQDATFTRPTYRVSLDQQINDQTLAYISLNRGFKSGGFDAQELGSPAFRPEVLDAYEAGLKTAFFDHRLTADAAAFYYDYKNIQIQKINPDGSLGILNGAKARADGVDLDFASRPTPPLQLTLGLEFLRTKFLEFPGAQISSPQGGVPTTVGSVSGNELPLASKFTGALGANYTIPLASGAEIVVSGNLEYNSGWYTEPDNFVRQKSFFQPNARASWTSANGRYNVAIWGENLNNVAVTTNAGTTAPGSHYVSYAPPRTYGVTVGVKY